MVEQNPDIAIALASVQSRIGPASQARSFYDGDQPDVYDAKKWRNQFGPNVAQPRDNMCPLVVDTVVSRLQPKEFIARSKDATDETGATGANDIAKRSRWDQTAPEVHRSAGKVGKAAVLVGVNSRGQAVFYPKQGDEVHFQYDPESPGTVAWTGFVWTVGGAVRVNLYYPTYTERWITNNNTWGAKLPQQATAFRPFDDDGKDSVLSNPMGRVPWFEFALDKSDLSPVFKLQPALDMALCDLLILSRAAGAPQRYVTGAAPVDESAPAPAPGLGQFAAPVPPPLNPPAPDLNLTLAENYLDGKPGKDEIDGLHIETGPDQTWFLDDPQAKAGSLPAAELEGTIKLLDNLRTAVLRDTSIPPHLAMMTTGDFPSGKALKTAEAQFVAKVLARMIAWGNSWEDAFAFAVQAELSHNSRGEFIGLAEMPALELTWEDPHTQEGLTEEARLDALIQIGAPVSVILADSMDYSPARAAEIEKLVREEADRKSEASATVFARGGLDMAA
ncbi:hypothetical protein [uncultured Friedmanniella sp.]|uniref:hypothetical protein n=1 Tax=uncultured Friedmanniella sp. TaxID=335381 RepID=UPI0035CBAF44